MTLRKKTLLVIGLTALALCLMLGAILAVMNLRGYSGIEREEIEAKVGIVEKSLQAELERVGAIAGDWAPWDEAYNFIRSVNPAFVDDNLSPDAMANLRISMVAFVGPDGGLRWPRASTLERESRSSPPADLARLDAADVLLRHAGTSDGADGLLAISGGGLMLVSSRPITTSDFSAPVAGTLVMGLQIDGTEIAYLARQTSIDLSITPVDGASDAREGAGADGQEEARLLQELSGTDLVRVKVLDKDVVAGYRLLRDLYGMPVALLEVKAPRSVHEAGMASLVNGLWALLVVWIVSTSLSALCLDRLVLGRLSRLGEGIERIGASRSLEARLEVEGDDELSALASITNQALSRLEEGSRALEASLREKDLLIREIHHRVKNNLQVVSSLLSLQCASLKDQSAQESIRRSQGRIRSMALIHELLYLEDEDGGLDLAHIEFLGYLRHLAGYLVDLHGVEPGRVRVEVEGDGIHLDSDTATDLGLIASELISNALQHAFCEGSAGKVTISLHEEGQDGLVLEVRDDGVGLPAGFDSAASPSMGFRLVHLLSAQLGADFVISSVSGKGCTASLRCRKDAALAG